MRNGNERTRDVPPPHLQLSSQMLEYKTEVITMSLAIYTVRSVVYERAAFTGSERKSLYRTAKVSHCSLLTSRAISWRRSWSI